MVLISDCVEVFKLVSAASKVLFEWFFFIKVELIKRGWKHQCTFRNYNDCSTSVYEKYVCKHSLLVPYGQ